MNRVLLIGNGFDLAHGLKTKYNDFIDDFWENKRMKLSQVIKIKENIFIFVFGNFL